MQDTFKTMMDRQDAYSVNSMGVDTTESQERIDAYRSELKPVDVSGIWTRILDFIALVTGV